MWKISCLKVLHSLVEAVKVNYLNDEERKKNHLRRREKKKDVKEEIRPRKKRLTKKSVKQSGEEEESSCGAAEEAEEEGQAFINYRGIAETSLCRSVGREGLHFFSGRKEVGREITAKLGPSFTNFSAERVLREINFHHVRERRRSNHLEDRGQRGVNHSQSVNQPKYKKSSPSCLAACHAPAFVQKTIAMT